MKEHLFNRKTLAATLGTAAVGFAMGSTPLFAAIDLGQGYQVTPSSTSQKVAQGSCGEGRCGGAAAADKATEGSCGEGKCGDAAAEKAVEGSCGEGKCGGAAGEKTTDKSTEGKCGEGRCGS